MERLTSGSRAVAQRERAGRAVAQRLTFRESDFNTEGVTYSILDDNPRLKKAKASNAEGVRSVANPDRPPHPYTVQALRPEPAQENDVKLLKAIAARNEAAEASLAQLYDGYRTILFGLLMRILNNREEAEDVLQELFMQVWRRAADFDENRGKPFTWLVTMARSRGIDRLRSLAARERVAIAGAREETEATSDAAADAFRSEQRGLVTNALAQLPDEQKRPLMLAYFDGLTQSEIAAQLGAPLGTVKTRMRSGMMKLRELLAGKDESFGF